MRLVRRQNRTGRDDQDVACYMPVSVSIAFPGFLLLLVLLSFFVVLLRHFVALFIFYFFFIS